MNITKLRRTIEKKDPEIAKKYEELFKTDLFTLISEIKKVHKNFNLNTCAQFAPVSNTTQSERYVVFYGLGFKDVSFQVANKEFFVKEKDLDAFLTKAKTDKVLKTVQVDLLQPAAQNSKISKLLGASSLGVKTLEEKGKTANSKIHKDLPWLNDVLWGIIEKNCEVLQSNMSKAIVCEIKQRKVVASHFKADIKTLKVDIDYEEKLAQQNPQEGKVRDSQRKRFEEELKDKEYYLKQEKGIIQKLKNKQSVLEIKDAKSDLSILFGKK